MSFCGFCCCNVKKRLSFDSLKSTLYAKLAGNKVDVDEIIAMLKRYNSNIDDWGEFALSDPERFVIILFQ